MTLTYGLTNRVGECADGRRRALDMALVEFSIWHRLTFSGDDGGHNSKLGRKHFPDVSPVLDADLDAVTVAERFQDSRRVERGLRHWADRPGSYTGGEVPYALLVRTTGHVEQLLPMTDYGPHSRRWSVRGPGIAIVGDFTRHRPTAEQVIAAVELGALLRAAYSLEPRGHTELPGASTDPRKDCPGAMWGMETFRDRVARHTLAALPAVVARSRLEAEGFEV